MSAVMGYIECGGVTVPIERIHIERGGMVFTGSRPGPLPAVSGDVTITGLDGIRFEHDGAHFSAPAVPHGKTARWLLAGHSSLAGQSPAGEDHPVIPGKVLPPGRAALTA